MTGSVLDGEDLVQEMLFEAYRKLNTYDDSRPLSPWLFRIAHNRSIDFLRRRGVREEAEAATVGLDFVLPADTPGAGLGRAVEHLVTCLPPKERASMLLKHVFDYTLECYVKLLNLYVERFNRRDWDGLRELISADARLWQTASQDRWPTLPISAPMTDCLHHGGWQSDTLMVNMSWYPWGRIRKPGNLSPSFALKYFMGGSCTSSITLTVPGF